MSIPIKYVINVAISLQAARVTQAGFGTVLIFGHTKAPGWSPQIREYASTTEVLADFSSSDDEYKAAAAVFSQLPSVKKLKIAEQGSQVAQITTLVAAGNFITGNTITGTVTALGVNTAISVPFTTDNATTLEALADAIEVVTGITNPAVDDGSHTITVTAGTAGIPFTLSGFVVTGGASQTTFTVTNTTPNHGIAEDIAAIQLIDDDWYGLIVTSRSVGVVQEAARFIESQPKMFVTCSSDSHIIDAAQTDDIAYYFKSKSYNRTAVIFNETPSDFSDAQWFGVEFIFDPGTYTMNDKVLVGTTVSPLTPTQYTAALNKHANVVIQMGGNNVLQAGTMASGIFADEIRSVDFLTARIEEAIFGLQLRKPKIPYTDPGAVMIENQIRGVLENSSKLNRDGVSMLAPRLQDDGTVLPAYEVTAPLVADQSANDRADRYFPGIEFIGRLASAIHTVDIQGSLTT